MNWNGMKWKWTLRADRVAILHRPYQKGVPYTEESLRMAIMNVECNTAQYHTTDAQAEQLHMFREGLELLTKGK